MDRKQRGLGRGLSALMADVKVPEREEGALPPDRDRLAPIEDISPNPDQPRRHFDDAELAELAVSIRQHGVLQPLIVRETPEGATRYQIVAGERRWRAAQIARLHEVPVLVREYSDTEVLQIAIIENVQRADLSPIEEARGYQQLLDRFGHTQERLAEALGKSRSHITNVLRLLQLPFEVQAMVGEGRLSAGHARALITLDDPLSAARQVADKGLSVRETERLVAQARSPGGAGAGQVGPKPDKDADTAALEQDLAANLGLKVSIAHKPGGAAGQVTIHYRSLEELDGLCRILSLAPAATAG